MFALTPGDLSGRILDCAAGPASFNTELTSQDHEVISCAPLYNLKADEIRARIEAIYDTMVANAWAARDEFVWHEFTSPEHLGKLRMAAMQRFLADFPGGLEERRYLPQALPSLDFRVDEFDLALCSHFLFTYYDQLSAGFHLAAIQVMCRAAGEARIFPLFKSYGGPSPYLVFVVDTLRKRGYEAEIREVPYMFQRGGDKMLTVKKPAQSAQVDAFSRLRHVRAWPW
jgi:hypothetical protein